VSTGERADAAQPDPLDLLAARAVDGDAAALQELCRALQHPIYRLALRFFGTREDPEDLTQEILVTVVTNLGSFEGRSKLMTWVWTIASRHLQRARTRAVEASVRGPGAFAEWLDRNLPGEAYDPASAAEYAALCGEVRIACTYGMLLCLSRDLRITYLLGDLVGLSDREGADVLEIQPATFRKRLSRAREVLRTVIADRCGLVRASNPCRCDRQIRPSIEAGILDTGTLVFTEHPRADGAGPIPSGVLEEAAAQLDLAEAIAEVYRSDPAWQAPDGVLERLRTAAPALFT
jgi:RNA polymerase sigma factor (sigma-70 family)